MKRNYNIILRNLSTPNDIMSEIEKLDLFNHSSQFNEMNDQLYDQYGLMVKLRNDFEIQSAKSFDIMNSYGDVVLKHGYSYGFPNEAKIEGLVVLAKYIKEHNLVAKTIDQKYIDKTIHDYERFYCKLPSYIKEERSINK